MKNAGWILAALLCLCTGRVWAETETFGTGEVDETTLMIGDRVNVAYTGRSPQGRPTIEEAAGTVVQVDATSFGINPDQTLTVSEQTITLLYERIIRLDRDREVFWALDIEDLQISEGEFIAKYLGSNELTGLEGMWVWEDRSFELVVVKDESDRIKRFDYIGLVLASTRPGWRMGEIKMLLKETATDGSYSAVFITGDKQKFNTLVLIQDEREILALLPHEVETSQMEKRHILRTYPVPPDPENENAERREEVRTGTGFFVTDEIIATANHLVEGADRIEFTLRGKRLRAVVRSRDKRNNIALLSVTADNRGMLSAMTVVPLTLGDPGQTMEGDRIVATGYPSLDAPRPSVSEGIVNSPFGPDGDLTRFTISTTYGANEVGGPLIDQSNRVVGILMPPDSSSTGAVNIALKATLLQSLLKMSGVVTAPSDSTSAPNAIDTNLIGQMARSAVVGIIAK